METGSISRRRLLQGLAGAAGIGLARPIFVDFPGETRKAYAAEDIRLTLPWIPEGEVAFMYVAREHWDELPPVNANWRSTSDPYGVYYGGPLDLSPSAARFDVSLAWFSWVGAAVSLKLLDEWRSRGILPEVVGLSRRLADQLDLIPPVGSVVSVPVENAKVVRADLADAGIKAAVRAGSVRLSPHVYNTAEQIDRAASALSRHVLQSAAR